MKKNIIICLVLVAGVFMALGIAAYVGYRIGRSFADQTVEDLKYQLAELEKSANEAAVTKRVSEQMGDIADQQVLVAQIQRDSANAMRQQAEKNAREANVLRRNAELASAEANKERDYAKEQEKTATAARDAAEEAEKRANAARDNAEILNYRRLGSGLGTTAYTQFEQTENNDRTVPSLLSYWSWYYLSNYNGNTYFDDTFKALLTFSGMKKDKYVPTHSCVTDICMIPGKGDAVVAVTDYGEVVTMKGDKLTTILPHADQRNFRALVATENYIYAMTLNGTVMKIDYKGNIVATSAVGKVTNTLTSYTHMLPLGNDRLILSTGSELVLVDINTLMEVKTIKTDSPLTCMYEKSGDISIHMKDGSCATVNYSGEIQNDGKTQDIITSGYWDSKTGLTMLGSEDGKVQVFNKFERNIVEIPGLKAAVTSILIQDTISVICSYDRQMLVCNMPKFLMDSGHSFAEEMAMKDAPLTHGNGPKEWVNPVTIKFTGWPLTSCGNSKTRNMWVGTSNGEIQQLCLSVDKMADSIKKSVKRNLTAQEWIRYFGYDVKQISIDGK